MPPLLVALLLQGAVQAGDIKDPNFQVRLVVTSATATSGPMVQVSKSTSGVVTNTINVEKTILLDENSIASAKVAHDSLGQPAVDIMLTKSGTKQFANITKQNVHQSIAILLDGRVQTTPVIQMPITRGQLQITGNFTDAEVVKLVQRLNAFAKK